MMLYTILSLEDIFKAEEPAAPAFEMLQRGSRTFEGAWGKNGFVISRMISTDLQDYLNEQFSPGAELK